MTSMVEIQKRIKLERTVVRGLIRFMKKKGFHVNQVYAGEDADFKVTTEKQIMDAVFDLDDCRLYFKEKNAGSVLLVRGNDPEEIITDWGYHEDGDAFSKAMDEFTEALWKDYD